MSAGGATALWDSVYAGIEKVRAGNNERKALLVLTDGNDNHSRYSLSEVKRAVRETDIRIYSITSALVQLYGVDELSDLIGGGVFRGFDPCAELAADLRNQFVIGYRPTNRSKDGTWRNIQVKVNATDLPKEMSGLKARARKGYTAAVH